MSDKFIITTCKYIIINYPYTDNILSSISPIKMNTRR